MATTMGMVKVAAPVMAAAFLLTLKPALRLAARQLSEPLRGAFLARVSALNAKTDVGWHALWVLAICMSVWIGSALTLDSYWPQTAVYLGAALGLTALYPYFYVYVYLQARKVAQSNAAT